MAECEAKIKKWGNSFGILIQKDMIEREGLRSGQKVHFILLKDSRKALKETFGTMKFGKSAQEIKNELRKELYGD